MTKYDFCTKSDSKGNCFWSSRIAAEDDCKKAIKRMIEVIQKKSNNNNYYYKRCHFK